MYQIDKRWGDDKILKARIILHKLILYSKENKKENYISEKILSYYQSSSHAKKSILIINYLEFMETMGYLIYKEKTITEEQVKNLCGYEVRLFYPIFEEFIYEMRKIHKDRNMFENFEEMYINMKK